MFPKKIYLAIPYRWNPEKAHLIANRVAAMLMREGSIVFSPISHSHELASYLPKHLVFDNDFWMIQDLPLVEWADELCVIKIGDDGDALIEQSQGVQMEISHAKLHNKKITKIEYHD